MAKITPIIMDAKYSALRALILILYVFSGLLIIVGLILALSASETGFTILSLTPIIVCLILAFNFVVMAQIISVFIDMEWNQREANELLQQIILNLPEQGK